MTRSRVYLVCQVLGWYAHDALNIMFAAVREKVTWNAVAVYLWGALAGIVATHGLRPLCAAGIG
jgi:hypothetical protein